MTKQRVFLDTNVIIECFRINVRVELSRAFRLETVEECEREALTGATSQPGRVQVDPEPLRAGLYQIHSVSRKERNKLLADHSAMTSLDPGERDLFAHLYSSAEPVDPRTLISTADKGAIVRAHDLHWLDQTVSLDELLAKSGASSQKTGALGKQYSTAFLTGVRTKVIMGMIP